jgi:CHAT domain-containing protein/Tfp pilus assembly protein PilF
VILAMTLAPAAAVQGAGPAREGDPVAALAQVEALFARSQYREAAASLRRLQAQGGLTAGQRARTLAWLAGAQVELGEHEQALRAAQDAEPLAREAGAAEALVRLEIARGSLWRSRGLPYRAVGHFDKALEQAELAKRDDLRAAALGALSSAYAQLGDWSRTLDYAERGFEIRAHPSERERFQYHVQRGVAYIELNDRERAEGSLREALGLARRSGSRRDESFALGELGLVAWVFDGDRERARELFGQARSIAREIGVINLEVSWLNNTGGVLRDSGALEPALRVYREALALAERSGQRRDTPPIRKNIGQVLAAQGKLREAEPVLLAALEDAERRNAAKIRWQARMELGGVYHRLGDAARAERYFEESLRALEDHQGSLLLEGFRVGMLGRALAQYDPYDRFIEFLLERGEEERAFAVAERARARVFLETLTSARAEMAAAAPRGYLDAETELQQRVSALQRRLRAPDLASRERQEAEAEAASAEDALAALRLRLAVERPALAHARFPVLWPVDRLRQEVLEADEVLALYFLGRRASAAWIVDRHGTEVVRLPGHDEIARNVRRLLPTLQSPDARVDDEARAWLSTTLVAPVLRRLPEGAPLVVVPHAALNYLPFEVLADDRGRYLVERNAVSYAPSASSLAFLRGSARGVTPPEVVLAVGSPASLGLLKPLPYSGDEIRRVAAVFRPHGRRLEGDAATERALRDAGPAAIVHFATHALMDEARPDRSGLALSPGTDDSDGVLQTREVYGLELDAALVTLSACQTALGRDVTGEGLLAMSRAFFYAGARSVAASLWSVNDKSTADLMARFYTRVRSGATFDRALAEAKRSFLGGRSARRHPYYWAPFVVTGHARASLPPAPANPVRWPSVLAAATATALAAGVMVLSRRRRTARTRAAASA